MQITAFADVHNLTIPEAFEEDSGTYMVRAINMAGEAKCYCKLTVKSVSEPMEQEEMMRMKRVVETKETQVKVRRDNLEQSPPEFQRLFQDLSVNAGDSVTLECSITGAPKPKVRIQPTPHPGNCPFLDFFTVKVGGWGGEKFHCLRKMSFGSPG